MRSLTSVALCAILLTGPSAFSQDAPIDFNRDIRPILSGKCFQCHGPDEGALKGKLRLDRRDDALKGGKSGERAVVVGKPDESEILKRVVSDDPDEVMPPPKIGKPVTERERELLKKWIAQGAGYSLHWSYNPPVRAAAPAVKTAGWAINPIDSFVLARLESEKLVPSKVADRHTLARRLSIDITGLPPSVEELKAFVADTRPDAYEKYVDALLAKPTYGERWGAIWLDLARYADSQGYANDPDRVIWRYRDWVVQALNANMPFDQFTIEQLAGDMLPKPTPEQLIATGFHRNTLTNTEGGTSPEEFRSAAVVDRVNTTTQVWMGSTFACAQCHSHKYDPFSHREYYQIYAIFNNSEDNNSGNDFPVITAPVVGYEAKLADAQKRLSEADTKFKSRTADLDKLQPEWEKTRDPKLLAKEIEAILAKAASARNDKEKQSVQAYHRGQNPDWNNLKAEVDRLNAAVKAMSIFTPVMKEGKPRETTIHLRGDYKEKGEKVTVGLPAIFPPAPKGEPVNRLTMARWLMSDRHPLTARVSVNRLWEELFGIGLVETSEEFGSQGEQPSHPELLDWLATEYVRLKWDTKAMVRLIVTSAAYRQSSLTGEEILKRDPYNRLVSRGPRFRLTAEMVRDQSLAVAGLLSPKMYGPPVQPPKPNFGLSAAFGGTTDWTASAGEDRYRRAIYIRQRRNAPYPSMTTFDAPERTFCNVRRIRTNTPLQALVTLNDPCFVEAAQGFARRILKDGGATTATRIEYAMLLALSRPATPAEVTRLTAMVDKTKAEYQKDVPKATKMATNPLGPLPKGVEAADAAAWTVLANVILNLDEALAKK